MGGLAPQAQDPATDVSSGVGGSAQTYSDPNVDVTAPGVGGSAQGAEEEAVGEATGQGGGVQSKRPAEGKAEPRRGRSKDTPCSARGG